MSQQEHTHINQARLDCPPCSRCGELTRLSRIDPAPAPGHDLRTFECVSCGNPDVVKIKFR